VRIFETLLHRAWNELLNFCVEKKGSTPDPLQLFRGQDPAQYLIMILIETIKDLYVSAQVGRAKHLFGAVHQRRVPTASAATTQRQSRQSTLIARLRA
jgi:hypothetical protein